MPGKSNHEGKPPSPEQRAEARQWITEFLQRWPASGLRHEFPDLARQAEIITLYNELERLRPYMDPIDYEISLERLAEAIDISELDPPVAFRIPLRIY